MKFNWNFQRAGVGGLRKNPFCGGGIDIFWNYTLICYSPARDLFAKTDKVS